MYLSCQSGRGTSYTFCGTCYCLFCRSSLYRIQFLHSLDLIRTESNPGMSKSHTSLRLKRYTASLLNRKLKLSHLHCCVCYVVYVSVLCRSDRLLTFPCCCILFRCAHMRRLHLLQQTLALLTHAAVRLLFLQRESSDNMILPLRRINT